MAADKFSDNVNTKGKITQGHSVASKIDFSGDEDWFKVSLKRGNSYEFILRGPGTGQGTLQDGDLNLFNASGISALGGPNSFLGTDALGQAHLVYTATTNGNYFIDAFSDSSSTGSYNLKFRRADIAGVGGPNGDPITDGTDTEGKIKVGQSKDGNLRFEGDDDWYAINLKANTSYVFQAYATFADQDDLTLTLRDAQGNVVQTGFSGNLAALGYTTGASGGKFFIDVGSSSSGEAGYNLTAGFGTLPLP